MTVRSKIKGMKKIIAQKHGGHGEDSLLFPYLHYIRRLFSIYVVICNLP
jgi:hypothetical protein